MKEFINNNKIAIVYFSGNTCSACDVIKSKIEVILRDYNEVKIMEINAVKEKEISAQLNVFSLPLVIIYIEGKESIRYGRNIDILEFKRFIDRFYNIIYK